MFTGKGLLERPNLYVDDVLRVPSVVAETVFALNATVRFRSGGTILSTFLGADFALVGFYFWGGGTAMVTLKWMLSNFHFGIVMGASSRVPTFGPLLSRVHKIR